uniref:OB domain-containing protein n=1 Tax=Strongyloides venezuelensis TaxID=75913 RepID=A0A0K0FIK7_STRVS
MTTTVFPPKDFIYFIIRDDENTKIRVVCFGERVTEIKNLIEVGSLYIIGGTNMSVKSANRPFTNVQHPCEIEIMRDAEMRLVQTTRMVSH